jgi:YHS domain-containing protein
MGHKLIVVSFKIPICLRIFEILTKINNMKKILGTSLICIGMLFAACDNPKADSSTTEAAAIDSAAAMAIDSLATNNYDVSLVNNKKDPTCGMPVTAGISDTTHYDNKVLGFCSKECKDEFLKNPKALIAAAEIK